MMFETSFSSNQISTLLLACFVNFFCSITASIQAPFYPAEAEKKGATATEYGLVFGCYEFAAFISSPFFGKIVQKTGSKFMFGIGLLVSSISVTGFGLLDQIESHFYFIFWSFLMRTMEGFGAAAATIACCTLAGCVFPDNLGTVMSIVEILSGFGFIMGPTVGGLLYEIGGFSLPFFFVGIVSGVLTILIFVHVPDMSKFNAPESSTGNLFNAIKTPSIAIVVIGVVICSASQSFYSATLEPHLRMFHISVLLVSMMFAINGLTYAVASPIVGRVVDEYLEPKYVLLISSILNIISFSIIGPLPFLPIPQTLTVCIIAIILQGLASACGLVASFNDGFQSAVAAGYPEDISTYGLIGGIWTSALSFGAFVGPSVTGFLYDHVGFQNATIFVVLINVILLVILLKYLKATKSDARKEIAKSEELVKLM